jgi:transcriptional regulator with XRE-family HTH domain
MNPKVEVQHNKKEIIPEFFSDKKEYKLKKTSELSSKLLDILEKKRITRSSFAQVMDVQPSVVTRWLSGSHNFTMDTLFDIEFALKTPIIKIDDNKAHLKMKMFLTGDQRGTIQPTRNHFLEMINYDNCEYRENKIEYSPLKTVVEK